MVTTAQDEQRMPLNTHARLVINVLVEVIKLHALLVNIKTNLHKTPVKRARKVGGA